jgi:type 1 fimbriae regulatory protein FimB/type 1 fimbriae regulatory protein FimE
MTAASRSLATALWKARFASGLLLKCYTTSWDTIRPECVAVKEVEKLGERPRSRGRYGRRDATMILLAYRRGLRASELCALRWDQVDLERGLVHVRRLKNGTASVHPMGGGEIRALRRLKREQIESRYVFVTERRAPMTAAGFRKMVARTGERGKFPFPVHPHRLRHACGYKLANEGQDTRAVQHYLGHRNIQHTVRYTELSPERFKSFWQD